MKNVVIFSGGTGSIALQKGLKKLNPNIKITNVVNAYDDGKSTGVCRKVFNTLGPSDIRKNQWTQYVNKRGEKGPNKILETLFEGRVDLIDYSTTIKYLNKVLNDIIIDSNSVEVHEPRAFKKVLKDSIKTFFDIFRGPQKDLEDFNLMNIMYAYLFLEYGINNTITYFKDLLNIEDDIVLNSLEEVNIAAIVEKNGTKTAIPRECDIVDGNFDGKIISGYFYKDDFIEESLEVQIDPHTEYVIKSADIIILSSGTQWSSLLPTYATKGVKEAIQKARAKKYLILNSKEDKDMIGVSDSEFLMILKDYLILDDFSIIRDVSRPFDNSIPVKYKMMYDSFKCENGKHDPIELASIIYRDFYNIENFKWKSLICDFDDTLYSRDENEMHVSLRNINLLSKISEHIYTAICSGNSFERIMKKIYPILGDTNPPFKIFCDGGLALYEDGKIINAQKFNFYSDLLIDSQSFTSQLEGILGKNVFELNRRNNFFEIEYRGAIGPSNVLSISLTKMEPFIRELIYVILKNNFQNFNINKSGRGSIDILKRGCHKGRLFEINGIDKRCVYIGDSGESEGNDKPMKEQVLDYINVDSVKETELILNLILEMYEGI